MKDKKILIFGTGATGSYFGSQLVTADYDVTFIARGTKLTVIQKNGILFKPLDDKPYNVIVNAQEKPVGKYDYIIISVKSKDTKTAVSTCMPHLDENGIIISMQNGVENIDILNQNFKPDNIGCGVIYSGISIPKAGIVEFRGKPSLTLGGLTVTGAEKMRKLADAFKNTAVNIAFSDNIMEKIWIKLLWNIAFNPLSALMNATCGDLLDNPHTKFIMEEMVQETVAAAAARGITLSQNHIDYVTSPNDLYKTYKTSSLQDVEANIPPEIEGIMGGVIRSSVNAPISKVVYELCKYKFDRWFHTFPRLSADVLVVDGDNVLLIERKNIPYGWAIPGGLADYGERIEHTAIRELEEETGIVLTENDITLLGIYSDPLRDIRGHMVSAVYFARGKYTPKAGDDAKDAKYYHKDNLPDLAFDHRKIIEDYFKKN